MTKPQKRETKRTWQTSNIGNDRSTLTCCHIPMRLTNVLSDAVVSLEEWHVQSVRPIRKTMMKFRHHQQYFLHSTIRSTLFELKWDIFSYWTMNLMLEVKFDDRTIDLWVKETIRTLLKKFDENFSHFEIRQSLLLMKLLNDWSIMATLDDRGKRFRRLNDRVKRKFLNFRSNQRFEKDKNR